jgi:hypothetical protein
MQHFDLATSARTLKTPHRGTTSPRPPRFNEGRGCQLRRRPHRAGRPPSSADILRREAATRLLRGTLPEDFELPRRPPQVPLDFSTRGPVANLGSKGAPSTWSRRVSRRGGLVRRGDTVLRTSKRPTSGGNYKTSSSGTSSLRLSISHTLSSLALCTAEGSATRA